MIDAVIVILVVIVVALALKSSVKHFKGEGGCCGGSGADSVKEIPEKQLSGIKLGEKIVYISGMHCSRCTVSVMKAINKIEGASAKVSLKQNRAVVSYDRELSDATIRIAVEKQGFKVTEIKG